MVLPARACPGRADADVTVMQALRRFVPELYAQRGVSRELRKQLDLVLRCRTPALGGHRYTCDHCGFTSVVYNSCRSRHCPQCQGSRRRAWLDRQQALLLQVPHFQVVFTLPSELRPLARRRPRLVYGTLFAAASHVLQSLAATRMDARLGVLAVLHTWARDLRFHPHVHCVVSAGGLRADGSWVATSPRFLFPHRAMQTIYRAVVLDRLRKELHDDPDGLALFRAAHRATRRKDWVVRVDAPDGRDRTCLVKYLARYVYQTALSDHRMRAVTDTTVTFRGRGRDITLSGVEFARRFAQHILPPRFRRVRHYGMYAPGLRPQLDRARRVVPEAADAPPPDAPPPEPVDFEAPIPCPECGSPLRHQDIPSDRSWPVARGPP